PRSMSTGWEPPPGLAGVAAGADLIGRQRPVGAVGGHLLSGRELETLAVDGDGDLVGLEGDEVIDAAHLAVGVAVGPGGPVRVADVVVVTQALVGTERLARPQRDPLLVDGLTGTL